MNFDLTEEQKMWQKIVHDFVEAEVKPKAHEISESGEFNWKAIRKMGPLGMLGMMVPEESKSYSSGLKQLTVAVVSVAP